MTPFSKGGGLFARLVPLALLAALAACGSPDGARAPIVAASIFPVADWCRNIAPESTEVLCLIPPTMDPHMYEPDVQQAKQLSRAQLVVCIGMGFDNWVEPLAAGAMNEKTRILYLAPPEGGNGGGEHAEDEEHNHAGDGDHPQAHGHHHGEGNPHLWLDPVWAMEAVGKIAERLAELNPGRADAIRTRAEAYRGQLQTLHGDIAARMDALPRREFAGDHSAWYHFARRYGLTEVVSIEPWAGKEPSIRDKRAIIDKLRAMERPVLFVEPQSNDQTARNLARELDCPVYPLDPLGNPHVEGRDTYINLMRFNTESFEKGLGGDEPGTASAP